MFPTGFPLAESQTPLDTRGSETGEKLEYRSTLLGYPPCADEESRWVLKLSSTTVITSR